MICENCGNKEANCKITKSVNGYVKEIHLCEECAKKLGYMGESNNFSLGDIMTALMGGGHTFSGSASPECKKCGTRLSEIQRTGYLGCSNCYESFMPYIKDILGRFQPKVKHIGKEPDKESKAIPKGEQLANMKKQLDELVKNQEYEKAAILRDEIIKLSKEDGKNE